MSAQGSPSMFSRLAGKPMESPKPPDGDVNRAAKLHSFTWILASFAFIFYGLRMYTRARLTRNLWWDDWFITLSAIFTLTFSVMWSVYAGRGYARHSYYLSPAQRSDAGELSVISRSCCIMAIATGKISVAFLIQRIQGPSKWRTWFLRFCSISVFITGLLSVVLLFAQCHPARASWTPSMIKDGTSHCWNPIQVNNYHISIAGYFAFLDFALAFLPLPIIWKLQMATKKKLLLSALLGMGVFAGVCAAIKTSQLRTVTSRTDITWKTAEYLLWNALEVNIIIIAACIPTLRPLVLVVFRQAGAEAYLRRSKQKSYQMTPKSVGAKVRPNDRSESVTSINGDKDHKNESAVHITDIEEQGSSGQSSRDGTRRGNESWTKTEDSGKRKSNGEILRTTEVQVSSYDEREREVQRMV